MIDDLFSIITEVQPQQATPVVRRHLKFLERIMPQNRLRNCTTRSVAAILDDAVGVGRQRETILIMQREATVTTAVPCRLWIHQHHNHNHFYDHHHHHHHHPRISQRHKSLTKLRAASSFIFPGWLTALPDLPLLVIPVTILLNYKSCHLEFPLNHFLTDGSIFSWQQQHYRWRRLLPSPTKHASPHVHATPYK